MNPNEKISYGYYPYFNVVFSMSIALFVLGFFLSVLMIAQSLLEKRRRELEVQVMLVGDKSEQEIAQIKNWISQKPYVASERIRFIHKDSSAAMLIRTDQKDFIKILGINPLKDALLVGIKPGYDNKTEMEKIKKELSEIAGVYEVELPLAQVEEIHSAISKLGFFVSITVLVFLTMTVFLIHNAIRLALFSQRFLIRSMKLVGATDYFIKKPFVSRGIIQGLISGSLAGAGLIAVLIYFLWHYPELNGIINYFRLVLILIIEVSVGVAVGMVATWISVTHFLKLKLDQLY